MYSAATSSQAPQTLFSLDKCPPRISNTAASDAGMATIGRSTSTGAIVGGGVGGCAFLGLLAAAAFIFVMMRRKRQKRQGGLHMVPDRHSSIDGKVRPQEVTLSRLHTLPVGSNLPSPRRLLQPRAFGVHSHCGEDMRSSICKQGTQELPCTC